MVAVPFAEPSERSERFLNLDEPDLRHEDSAENLLPASRSSAGDSVARAQSLSERGGLAIGIAPNHSAFAISRVAFLN